MFLLHFICAIICVAFHDCFMVPDFYIILFQNVVSNVFEIFNGNTWWHVFRAFLQWIIVTLDCDS